MPNYLNVNRTNPVNWGWGPNQGLVAWYKAIPNYWGGLATWYDLCKLNNGTLVNMNGSTSGPSPQAAPGGDGSMLFNAAASTKVSIPNVASLNFGAGNFTVSWREYRTSNANGATSISVANLGSGDYAAMLLGFSSAGSTLAIYMSSAGSSWDIASAKSLGTVTLNTWCKFRITRIGTSFFAYKNGVQTDTWPSSAGLWNNGQPTTLGVYVGALTPFYFSGYMDSVRFASIGTQPSQGVAIDADDMAGNPRALNRIKHARYPGATAGGLLMRRRRACA